jgi:hypothetical protein
MTIKPLTNLLLRFFPFTVLLILTACGGGGGSGAAPQPQKVTATFALQGSPTTVGSAQLNVVLPDSFVLEVENGSTDQPTASALLFLVPDVNATANYIPAAGAVNGTIDAAIIKADGFPGTANLMQISRIYVDGEILPTVDDFIVTVAASDFNGSLFDGNLLPKITGKITIDIQPVP